MTYILIIISAVFVNNIVLSQFLGICPFLGVSNNVKTALGMSASVMFVMVLSTMVTYILFQYVLVPFDLQYLITISFILIIAALVQMVEIVLKKVSSTLYEALGVFLPLITTNCAVLAVTIMNIDEGYTYAQALFNALGAGLGFLLAMVLFAGLRQRLEESQMVPAPFKGIPITLITASILSLSFMGFGGIVDGIFA